LKSQQLDETKIPTVVVHQHLLSGRLDMRDSLVLHRADLLPIRLDTDRDGPLRYRMRTVYSERCG
jgi:hypothetical protein